MKTVIKLIKRFVISVLLASIVLMILYVSDYYRADKDMIVDYYDDDITKKVLDDNTIVFESDGSDTALIFYPGGKVEYSAYEPLMVSLAKEGITCFLVEVPFKLAILDIKAADGIKAAYPEYTNWYIGGHSLGGSVASMYLDEHHSEYQGLILSASYASSDLSNTNLEVLSIYGSEDKVLNMMQYHENKVLLPNIHEYVIEGGNHAYFGVYGKQSGDGEATIDNQTQIFETTSIISSFINE